MNIAIIGAGFTGLTAAHDLLKAGHKVTLYESAPHVGGLASGFKLPKWDWTIERFYHHIFTTDADILRLAEEVGVREKFFFNDQITAFFCKEHGSHAVSLMGVLTYPHMPLIDRIRYGLSGVIMKLRNDWQYLETQTAENVMRKLSGNRAYEERWGPLLDAKFGPFAKDVNAAWMWARVKSRSFKLGYYVGGFQAFADALADRVRSAGATLHLNARVSAVRPAAQGWTVHEAGGDAAYDRVLIAAGPGVIRALAPDLPADYLAGIGALKSMGAVVLVASLSQSLLTSGEYWFMPPKGEFPYLNVVEHTNMLDKEHYGNDTVIYLGDYLPQDHHYFTASDAEIADEWFAPLNKINPAFKREWVKHTWVFREKYAQPIPFLNHSRNVPTIATPLPGLFFASMSHVYPWDRGTNFAVKLGREAARLVAKGKS
jgi:protoporphyrinogen oxidase